MDDHNDSYLCFQYYPNPVFIPLKTYILIHVLSHASYNTAVAKLI